MGRFTQEIKRQSVHMSVAILSAGIGNRIKSYEPRSLLKAGKKTLIDCQIEILRNQFKHPDIILVVGTHANKVIKKIDNSVRVVENQLYRNTNSFESLRLAVNNAVNDSILFLHGDLFFNQKTLHGLSYNKSFVIVDKKKQFHDREVGVNIVNNKASIFSYGLSDKWCQMAYLTGREFLMLKQICCKNNPEYKKMLTFEALNSIINKGGQLFCYEPEHMKIREIDCMRDFDYESFNI